MGQTLYGHHENRSTKKNPCVHAKSKTSNHKTSKNYTKKYKGQGR